MPKIITSYVFPPIPVRHTDWCACLDGHEEFGPYGWGPTEQAAIDDLRAEMEEKGLIETVVHEDKI